MAPLQLLLHTGHWQSTAPVMLLLSAVLLNAISVRALSWVSAFVPAVLGGGVFC